MRISGWEGWAVKSGETISVVVIYVREDDGLNQGDSSGVVRSRQFHIHFGREQVP